MKIRKGDNVKRFLGLLSTIVLAAVLLSGCSGGSDRSESGPVGPPEITSWAFVDGDGANGINKNTASWAEVPQMTVFGSKLYATWTEASQIRVAVYNGNDSSPEWTFVDGNGANGINKNTANWADTPQLTVFNSKLYATWTEAYHIRMAVYNGNDSSPEWTFVDGNGVRGINKDATKLAQASQLTVFNSKLYATWEEGYGGTPQIRMAVYNGNDSSPKWTFVDGNGANGINKDATKLAEFPQLTVFKSGLYATWEESNGIERQIRMAVYNGDDSSPKWTFVDGDGVNGINKDASKAAWSPQLTVFNSKLYATWEEFNSPSWQQIRMAVYNGDDSSPQWIFVDGNGVNGINKNPSNTAQLPQLTVNNSKLYATWEEFNGTAWQVRIAVYNGNDNSPEWVFIDGAGINGINKNAAEFATQPQLTAYNSKLYAIWDENNDPSSQIRMAVGR